MSFILAALSAALYGIADFAGGLASKRSSVFPVIGLSQIAGAILALLAIPFLGSGRPLLSDLLFGAVAGTFGAVGLFFLYKGLAETIAAVVSPTAAIVGAVVPIMVGVFRGEVPSIMVWVGCAICLPAIFLLTWEKREPHSVDTASTGRNTDKITHTGVALSASVTERGVVSAPPERRATHAFSFGLAAGLGFGAFFVFISRTSSEGGLWPLISARAVSITIMIAASFIRHEKVTLPASRLPLVILTGVFDMGANILFLFAVRQGMLILVSAVAALYPAPTVLLSRFILKQPMGLHRITGFLLALGGMVIIHLG